MNPSSSSEGCGETMETNSEEMSTTSCDTHQEQEKKTPKSDDDDNKATCMIVLGMAGSGKTTFVQKLAEHLHRIEAPGYLINLDPACHDMPYPANIDIRDTINYKRVMKEYELGPNGAIITSLNLFTTKFDQLLSLIEQRRREHKHFILDTPGQIEVFNWSASGMIITETLASQMPTVIVYVIDTVRNTNPSTFMSNMLYACSILYKTKLPLIIVFNKTDLQNHDFLDEWMTDFEKFEQALENEQDYISSLTRSLSLVLDAFYNELKTVGVSSLTGVGMDDFLEAVDEARKEYLDIYINERNAMNHSTKEIADNLSKLTVAGDTIKEELDEEEEDETHDNLVT